MLLVMFYLKINSYIKTKWEIIKSRKKICTITVGGEKCKMCLTASAIMQIEKKLDKPLFTALENIQENMIETVITIIWGAAQAMNHNFTFEKAAQLFDDYIDEGHSVKNLMIEIKELLKASGFFTLRLDLS